MITIRHPTKTIHLTESVLYQYSVVTSPCSICGNRNPNEPDTVMITIDVTNYHSNCYVDMLRKKLDDLTNTIRKRIESNKGFGFPGNETEWMALDVESIEAVNDNIIRFFNFIEYDIQVGNPGTALSNKEIEGKRYVSAIGFDYNGRVRQLNLFVQFSITENITYPIMRTDITETENYHLNKMIKVAEAYIEKWKKLGVQPEEGVKELNEPE